MRECAGSTKENQRAGCTGCLRWLGFAFVIFVVWVVWVLIFYLSRLDGKNNPKKTDAVKPDQRSWKKRDDPSK